MKPLCLHPWTSLDVSPQFDFKPCCKFRTVVGRDLNEYSNSAVLADAKEDLLNGKFPPGCIRCKLDEEAGLPSKRQIDSTRIFTQDLSKNDYQVLSITVGNTCNLMCATCGDAASSKWRKFTQEHQREYNLPIHSVTDIKTSVKHFEDYASIINNCKDLTIGGGEPLLFQDEIERLLSNIADPGSCSITIITNCTIFPNETLIQLANTFKEFTFLLSIDGTNDVFEHIRWPAKWPVVYENIKRYQDIVNDVVNLSISHTVSVLNVEHVLDFIKWCLHERLPIPYLGMVHKPAHLSITSLPAERKEELKYRVPSNVRTYMLQQDTAELYELGKDYITSVVNFRSRT